MKQDCTIYAEGIGKRYRLGREFSMSRTFREALVSLPRSLMGRRRPIPPDAPTARPEDPDTPAGSFWALRDLNLAVRRGEVFGVIGPNGAGKSTLLKILSRITKPTTGRAEVRGRLLSLLEVGTGFHPELTGRENIYLNGAILGMTRSEIDTKFDEIVAFSDIGEFLDTPVKRYSSGMYVRLGFAVAAHLEPDVLIVDEVLAVGDASFQKKCFSKVRGVAGEGRTVLMVSHNMGAIRSLCTSVLLLDKGKQRMFGPPEEIVSAYIGGSTPDRSERPLALKDHVFGGEQVRYTRIRLLNAVHDTFTVHWREPIVVCAEIEVRETVRDINLGVSIKTLEGSSICSIHHDDHGAGRWTLETGRYRFEVTVQNDLRPGVYWIGVGAHVDDPPKGLCYLPEAAALEVLESSKDGERALHFNTGLTNGRAHWQLPERLPE